jgi:squalene-hopene/tetraprenyl-beta-curcumene cyclase
MESSTMQTQSPSRAALERACERLLSQQDPKGFWHSELQTNVTMDAEDLLLREFLGIRTGEQTDRSTAWIRSQQRADGTWANFHGGPGELSTTIEAYCALRLAGDPPEADHMCSAASFIRTHGGVERARVFTHLWLALFGLWSWDRVPALPTEIILLPSWAPLNVYDFACWARQTIVAVSLVKAHRPVRALPFDLNELRDDGSRPDGAAGGEGAVAPSEPESWWGGWFARLDRLMRAYERRPIGALRRLAIAHAERWVVRRQEADGSWGGIQPPWVYSLMALSLCGYPIDHPVMKRGLDGLERFMIEDHDDSHGVGAPAGQSRRMEACQSPVWDTALALIALDDAGFPAGHAAIARAVEWLLAMEVTVPGDWSIARPDLAPGGWAFEFANANYPDVDDTVEVVLALRPLARKAADRLTGDGGGPRFSVGNGTADAARTRQRIEQASDRALRWVEGMQSAGGGWGAFDAENTRSLVREIPFLDFGEVIDEPSADVTAHAVEMLAALGLADAPAARRGVRWLIDQQEPGGSWFGRWGVNHVYGTGAAVPALVAAGIDPAHECIRRAVRWLEEHQNEDGGWGEDPRSYDDPAWIGRGSSTASQTAWALLALHAAGERSQALERGVDWLLATQRSDGGWDEPQYTGTGFPSDYYINYHLYRLVFPVMALGRCLRTGTQARGRKGLVADGERAPARRSEQPVATRVGTREP